MALRKILEFPDPRLRTIAKPVETVDDSIRTLIDDMFETMYEAQGIGLAATQIDVHLRVVVIDLQDDEHEPLAQEILDAYKFIYRLLDPEGFGFAVSAEVRDAARVVVGLEPVEQNLYKTKDE